MTILRRAPFSLRPNARYLSSNASNTSKVTVGIRREDPSRIWERRCPISPDAVHELVNKERVNVLIQPCERRVWPMEEFIKAGAQPHPTLSPSHITIGIKETPLPEVLTDTVTPSIPRTHLMFSHTAKGQHYNMELLSKFLNSPLSPRLIDYELLVGEDGKRTVGFGWFAGVAGVLESLCAFAHAHLEIGFSSPFLYTPRPFTHPSLESIRATLRDVVGARIAAEGTPKGLGPIVFGVTGSGKVAQGALDLLEDLPIVKVKVKDLPALVSDPDTDLRKIYICHALPEDYFVRQDGQAYTRSDYYANPQLYDSVFHDKIAPYLSLLIHGAGWAPSFPRIMTNGQLILAQEKAQNVGKGRFICVGDISCDVEGGLQFLPRHSTLSTPFFVTKPPLHPSHLPAVTIMAVDILPTSLPLEASTHFSNVLLPYLKTLIQTYPIPGAEKHEVNGETAKKVEALERATIASGGLLRSQHEWLESRVGTFRDKAKVAGSIRAFSSSASTFQSTTSSDSATTTNAESEPKPLPVRPKEKHKVLVLGSGMVAGPAIDEICRWGDVELLVATNVLEEAEKLVEKHPNASAIRLDAEDHMEMGGLISHADVVISLLPVPLHPQIAELCIRNKKHFVTASYISPAMKALHDQAQEANVLLLNEIGLDPGIDHCSTMKLLDELAQEDHQVVSFTSFCGGLPAPESAEVDEASGLRYKFSWSPKGVLSAALNGAKFKLWNSVEEISGSEILNENFPDLPILDGWKLEGIANRDSLPYADSYGLGSIDDIRTLCRGTIRYQGFSSLMHKFKLIGLLETDTNILPTSWSDLSRLALESKLGNNHTISPTDEKSFRSALAHLMPKDEVDEFIDALQWFGITNYSSKTIHGPTSPSSENSISLPRLHKIPQAPIDIFASLLAHKLAYKPGERDLVILAHEVVSRPRTSPHVTSHAPSPTPDETVRVSELVTYGTPQASAMARCVGLPVAFAARSVLDGEVTARGVCGPGVEKAVWGKVLSGLEEAGLGMREFVTRRRGPSGGGVVEGALHRAHALRRGAKSF